MSDLQFQVTDWNESGSDGLSSVFTTNRPFNKSSESHNLKIVIKYVNIHYEKLYILLVLSMSEDVDLFAYFIVKIK